MRENPQQRFQLMGVSQQCERTMWDLQVPEFGLQVFLPGAQFNQHKDGLKLARELQIIQNPNY